MVALAVIDADQHGLAADIPDVEVAQLEVAWPCAETDAEGGAMFQARAGSSGQQVGHVPEAARHRLLARLAMKPHEAHLTGR